MLGHHEPKCITWNAWNLSFCYILFDDKILQTMLWHPNARVNSHQRWKQTRFRVYFHLWCELTNRMNVTEWPISWNSWYEQGSRANYQVPTKWTRLKLPPLSPRQCRKSGSKREYKNNLEWLKCKQKSSFLHIWPTQPRSSKRTSHSENFYLSKDRTTFWGN